MTNVLILVILCLVVQIQARSIRLRRSLLEPEAKECIEQLNLNEEEIKGIQNLSHAPDDHANYIQFMDCYWKKVGYLAQNGDLNHDFLKAMIDELLQQDFDPDTSKSIAVLVMNKCKDIEGDSHGQKAIRIGNCIMKNIRQILVALLS